MPKSRMVASAVGPVIGMLVALGISWIYAGLRAESEERQRLVVQLLAAQDDVLAAQEQLALSQHRAGVLAERSRLARDIHDTLAQGFSSILLLSRAGRVERPEDRVLAQIEASAQQGLTEAREVVHALTPHELTPPDSTAAPDGTPGAPLPDALRRLTDQLSATTQINARTDVVGIPHVVPTAIEVALVRIAQGGLANVRQHSCAQTAQVVIDYSQADRVELRICDDGVGFTEADIERAPLGGSGFGLRAMRERTHELGGSVHVDSTPGQRTEVTATLPVPATPASTS